MNFIITSEHRVGSRWMHYLFAELLGMSVSPEIDVTKITTKQKEIITRLGSGRIVKFHRAAPNTIFEKLNANYKLLGVVRNPRDRGVSLCFHNRYHENNPGNFLESKFKSDERAMEYTIMHSHQYKDGNTRQLKYMLDGYSTRNHYNNSLPYIWTSYEWLKEDTFAEVKAICEFLERDIPDERIKAVIEHNSFKAKAGRVAGKENRKDNWRRKGVNNDWRNWFDGKMIEETENIQNAYFEKLSANDKK